MDQKEVLSKGKVELLVRRKGSLQRLTFFITREKISTGEVPYLTTDKQIELPELIRISEEYQLPVKSLDRKVFPRGKAANDFVNL